MLKFISYSERFKALCSTRSRAFSALDIVVGLAVIFVTLSFSLAAKRDMMSAEAPFTPAPELQAGTL